MTQQNTPTNRQHVSTLTILSRALRSHCSSDSGFMGLTHAFSALAVVLTISLLTPTTFSLLHVSGLWQALLLTLIVVGGAMMPDLDNTQSSAMSALGPFGMAISYFMRATSPIVSNLLHGRFDHDLNEAHRKFYHTTVAAVLAGVLVTLLCALPGYHGLVAALVFAFIGTHVALCALYGTLMYHVRRLAKRKVGSTLVGVLITMLISFLVTLGLWWNVQPGAMHPIHLGLAFGVGWLIHLLGDTFTTKGTPLLFPIPIRGKLWFDVRLLPIHAGGIIETAIILPFFMLVSVIEIVLLVLRSLGKI